MGAAQRLAREMVNWTKDWPKEEQTNFAELISLAEAGLIAGELAQALRDIGRELKEDRSSVRQRLSLFAG